MTAALQPFTLENRTTMKQFLLDICEVPDFYESLELDNYVALSKKDLELTITLNEVYGMHQMLQDHQNELVSSIESHETPPKLTLLQIKEGSTHLGILLQELGPAPPEVPRKDNRAICLPLYSKWETRLDDLSAALDITPAEVLFMEAKSTFVLLMRSLPADSHAVERPLRLDQVARAAATTRNDAIMVRKGIRGIELLSQLQDMNILTKKDGFSALREEVEQELIHLGSAKDTALKDLDKLQEVFRSIREHNAYLNQQLDTYKDYLKNVRDQAAGRSDENKKDKKSGKPKAESSVKYTQPQLEKDGVVVRSSIPPDRRINVFFLFVSTTPGAFIINLFYKGN